MYSYPYHALELPSMIHNDVAFYAFLFIGTSMYSIQAKDADFHTAAHMLRGKCIRMVNNALKNVEEAIKDETVLLIVCLTFEAVSITSTTDTWPG
jgi:hypothetical protein